MVNISSQQGDQSVALCPFSNFILFTVKVPDKAAEPCAPEVVEAYMLIY